jgi:hypothetical protein
VRKVIYRDPDGNVIGFGGAPLELPARPDRGKRVRLWSVAGNFAGGYTHIGWDSRRLLRCAAKHQDNE